MTWQLFQNFVDDWYFGWTTDSSRVDISLHQTANQGCLDLTLVRIAGRACSARTSVSIWRDGLELTERRLTRTKPWSTTEDDNTMPRHSFSQHI